MILWDFAVVILIKTPVIYLILGGFSFFSVVFGAVLSCQVREQDRGLPSFNPVIQGNMIPTTWEGKTGICYTPKALFCFLKIQN